MKGSCNYQPESIIEYGRTATGQVLFNIERNDKEIDGVFSENWDFEYCEVDNFRRETVIAGVIRSRYTDNSVEALLANFQRGEDIVQCFQFQNWRDLAKLVADGSSLKSEVAEIYARKIIKVTALFSDTLDGGKWAMLADYAIKAGMKYVANAITNTSEIYASWLSAEHLALIHNDNSISITEVEAIAE